MVSEKSAFTLDDKVRFTQERLDALSPQDRRRLEGRIGVVQGFRSGIRKPTVYFPATREQSDLRLFDVDPKHIEFADDVGADPAASPQLSDDTQVSQGEVDNLFD